MRTLLRFPEERTLVAGDGANDISLFFDAGRECGVIVGNAEERLVAEHKLRARPVSLLLSRWCTLNRVWTNLPDTNIDDK